MADLIKRGWREASVLPMSIPEAPCRDFLVDSPPDIAIVSQVDQRHWNTINTEALPGELEGHAREDDLRV